ncbi:MAG: NYN domain-containing protein [Candidatus Jettenia sp.]|nr:MAG: NYN domain-containing protein [Candidatus Jettenia sp.]
MLIIIDGYNFIFTVPELEKYVEGNHIEPVRNYVISLLSKYKEKKHYEIIIVFDGNCTEVILPKKQTYSGITVVYSKSGINADTEIKNITSLCRNPKDVRIVTYDNDIKRHVKKCGCQIIEPKIFYKEILEIINKTKKPGCDEYEDKQNSLSEKDSKYWKDIFKDISTEELKPNIKKADIPKIKNKKGPPPCSTGEPLYKYQGPSPDETHYWLRVFKGIEKDEHKD